MKTPTLIIIMIVLLVPLPDGLIQASDRSVITAANTEENAPELRIPSYSYRISLLMYFITPVLLLVILLMLKIYQLDKDERSGKEESALNQINKK